MKILLTIFAIILIFNQDKAMTLDDLKWKNRILLYFPSSDQEDFWLNDKIMDEIKERKLAFYIFQDSLISNKMVRFSASYIQHLENKYKLGSKNASYVLIGLDGGVKMKKEEPLDWNLIFQTIDAMPMRQSEIRKNN